MENRKSRIDTAYVAFANTAMGMVTLLFGLLGVLAQIFGITTLIVINHPDIIVTVEQ
jgi:hypothetical protein